MQAKIFGNRKLKQGSENPSLGNQNKDSYFEKYWAYSNV